MVVRFKSDFTNKIKPTKKNFFYKPKMPLKTKRAVPFHRKLYEIHITKKFNVHQVIRVNGRIPADSKRRLTVVTHATRTKISQLDWFTAERGENNARCIK